MVPQVTEDCELPGLWKSKSESLRYLTFLDLEFEREILFCLDFHFFKYGNPIQYMEIFSSTRWGIPHFLFHVLMKEIHSFASDVRWRRASTITVSPLTALCLILPWMPLPSNQNKNHPALFQHWNRAICNKYLLCISCICICSIFSAQLLHL